MERSAEGAGALMVGTGVVSTVTTPAGEGPLVLPAASAAVAENGWGPSARSELGVKVQLPFESAVAVPATAPSILTLTVAPGSAVPLNGGRNCEVTEPSAVAMMLGAAGGSVSIVKQPGGPGPGTRSLSDPPIRRSARWILRRGGA